MLPLSASLSPPIPLVVLLLVVLTVSGLIRLRQRRPAVTSLRIPASRRRPNA